MPRREDFDMGKLRVGVLLISTGKYDQFVKPLLDSLESHFLVDHEKKYYLFTDKEHVDNRVAHVRIERKGFPGDTLYRFHYFLTIEDILVKETDCLYYMDVDMLCVNAISNEILPTLAKPLVATSHPGFFLKSLGTPEDDNRSTAFISNAEYRPCYWAGGFSGGATDSYLTMAKTIKENVDIDTSRGKIAKWHDESHLNRYLASNLDKVKTMNPSYCYSGKLLQGIPFVVPRLVALDKNHSEVRS